MDSITPNAMNSQTFDRYAYVLNNPLNYTDPSGYKYCDSFDAYGNCIDEDDVVWPPPPPPPTPDNFPSTDPTDKSQDPRTAFNSIVYLRTLTKYWWGSELTAQELIAIILFLGASVGVYQDERGNWQMNGDVIEMMTRKYNQYCGSGSWSSSCFTGFWRYFQPLLILNADTLAKIQTHDLNSIYGGVYITTAGNIMNNIVLGGEAGYPGRPTHWATISPSQTILFERLKEMLENGKLKYFHAMEGDSIFIVLSVNEATELCGSTNCMH